MHLLFQIWIVIDILLTLLYKNERNQFIYKFRFDDKFDLLHQQLVFRGEQIARKCTQC